MLNNWLRGNSWWYDVLDIIIKCKLEYVGRCIICCKNYWTFAYQEINEYNKIDYMLMWVNVYMYIILCVCCET